MSDADLRRLLVWAAGAPTDVSDIAAVDEDRLLALLWQHRLYPRLAARVEAGKPRWYSRRLAIGVWTQCREARQQLQRQMQALHDILKAWPAEEGPLVIVKGLTTHALTGDARHIRFSSDLDVLCRDIPRFCGVLQSLGYDVSSTWAAHHSVRCSSGPILIEPHNHFPMQAYPAGMQIGPSHSGAPGRVFTADDFAPEKHPGHWIQPALVSRYREVRHAELMEHLIPSSNPDVNSFSPSGPLLVLDSNMAILIICQNIFKDFISGALYGERWLRIGDLADIRDLVHHSSFEEAAFRRLRERYACEDAVALVGSLSEEFLGNNPLMRVSNPHRQPETDAVMRACFPRRLSYWDYCWATLDATAEATSLAAEPGSVIERLGTNKIMAGRGGVLKSYTACASGEGLHPGEEALQRVIVNLESDSEWTGAIRFSVAYESEAMHVHVWLPHSNNGGHEQTVSLFIGLPGGDHLWMNTGPNRSGFETDHVSVSCDQAGFTFAAVYPWDVLPTAARDSACIPALLQVVAYRRQIGHPDEVVFPTLTIPLHIISDKVQQRGRIQTSDPRLS